MEWRHRWVVENTAEVLRSQTEVLSSRTSRVSERKRLAGMFLPLDPHGYPSEHLMPWRLCIFLYHIPLSVSSSSPVSYVRR